MPYVIGIDLGTSAVKLLLVDPDGNVCGEETKPYPIFQEKSGYSEQNPEDWVDATIQGLKQLTASGTIRPEEVEGISFSGQMHGLVLLDGQGRVLRNAILWNDTRTTEQCRHIESVLGDRLLGIAKNPALEGFTLPKLLWVKQHEPQLFAQAAAFVLPKDYVRYRLTGMLQMELSDAAGTLLLDVARSEWSRDILAAFDLAPDLCPPLIESHALAGTLPADVAQAAGLAPGTKVFAGGADNACGAVGAGILRPGAAMCSIGTSGVILTHQSALPQTARGNVHIFNHAQSRAYYMMGVTLSAGYSLSWLKDTFAPDEAFGEFAQGIAQIPPGAHGLLFTPYLTGERTPYADAEIRASFIGADAAHTRSHFVRAVMEGITFSLKESLDLFREAGQPISQMVSIGGGAKNEHWLQMQADIFDADIQQLESEQGPGMGAAMIAAVGCGWFSTLDECADKFVRVARTYRPKRDNVELYARLYRIYKQIYPQTQNICAQLGQFRA